MIKKFVRNFVLAFAICTILATPSLAATYRFQAPGTMKLYDFTNPYTECGTVTLNKGRESEITCPLYLVPSGTVVTARGIADNMPLDMVPPMAGFVYTYNPASNCLEIAGTDTFNLEFFNKKVITIEDNFIYLVNPGYPEQSSDPEDYGFCICSENFDTTGIVAGTFSSDWTVPTTDASINLETAYATNYSITVDGQTVSFDAYALKDENGNDTNYLKLRDVAYTLNGSQAQFNVGWDGAANAITITKGVAYVSNGSEMSTPFSGDQPYTPNQAAVLVDGQASDLQAIMLTDDSGSGYTYFKLRDLGQTLGFNITWDGEAGAIVIDTTQPYQG